MKYTKVVTGLLGENCYLIYCDSECVIVDPGDDLEKIVTEINNLELLPMAIFLTHTHFDHVGACAELSKKFNLPVYVSRADYECSNSQKESVYHMKGEIDFENLKFVTDDQEICIGKMKFKVITTPGHSKGSVCYFIENLMVGGDVLFRESVGRTDLDGGSPDEMRDTFKNKIMTLDENYIVLPGHGETTTIGYELRHNPYINYYYKKF